MKPKPWNMTIGMALGLLIGAILWWSNYVPGNGLFQNLQLLLMPAVFGVLVVNFRNKRKRVGPYDPDMVAKNKRGRL